MSNRIAGLLAFVFSLFFFLVLGACSPVEEYGLLAAQKRVEQNDLQARATMAAVCDLSLGAADRTMSDEQLRFALEICWQEGEQRLLGLGQGQEVY